MQAQIVDPQYARELPTDVQVMALLGSCPGSPNDQARTYTADACLVSRAARKKVLEAIASKLEEKLQQTVASDKAVETRILSDWEQLVKLKVDLNHAWIYLIRNPKGRGWGITLYDCEYPMQLPKGSRCSITLRGDMPVLCQAQMVPACQRYPWDFDRCYVAMDGSTVACMVQPGCDCVVVYPAPKVNNLQLCSIDMEGHGRCLVSHGSTHGEGRRVVPVLMEGFGRHADGLMEVIDVARVVQAVRVNGNKYSQG